MSGKSKRKPQRPVNMRQATRAALTMFLWAYSEVHKPTIDDMVAISNEILKVQEGVSSGRLKISEIEEALEDEYGWKVVK